MPDTVRLFLNEANTPDSNIREDQDYVVKAFLED